MGVRAHDLRAGPCAGGSGDDCSGAALRRPCSVAAAASVQTLASSARHSAGSATHHRSPSRRRPCPPKAGRLPAVSASRTPYAPPAAHLRRRLDAVNLAANSPTATVLIPAPGDPPPSTVRRAPGTPSAPLDLNTATVEQLDTLPGVGEVTAGRIVAYRSAHPFTAIDELLEVPGIGQRRFEQLKDLVTVT